MTFIVIVLVFRIFIDSGYYWYSVISFGHLDFSKDKSWKGFYKRYHCFTKRIVLFVLASIWSRSFHHFPSWKTSFLFWLTLWQTGLSFAIWMYSVVQHSACSVITFILIINNKERSIQSHSDLFCWLNKRWNLFLPLLFWMYNILL